MNDNAKPKARLGRRKILKALFLPPLALALLGVLLASCRTSLSPLPPPEQRNYQSLLEWSHRNGMPGAILLVRTPGHEFIDAVGEADLKRHIPMRTNYAFQIASVTKTFMGAVAAQLHAEGKIDLDLSITNWLPREVTQRLTNANRITLRQLLEHTSGLPDAYDDFWFRAQRGFLRACDDWEPMKVLEYTFDRPTKFEPGKGWRYCNAGYLLAGLSIDHATGHHYSTEIRKRISTPLNLTNTFYLTVEKPSIEMAHGYENYFNWWRMDATDWTPATGGSAGLASTVFDLATFIRAVVREDKGGLLNPAARREMFAGWTNSNKNYFLGIQRKRIRPEAPWFLGHSGGTPGYHTIVFHQPERDITIVYFGSSILHKVRGGSRLLDEFYDTFRDALFEQALKETDMPAAGAGAGARGTAERHGLDDPICFSSTQRHHEVNHCDRPMLKPALALVARR